MLSFFFFLFFSCRVHTCIGCTSSAEDLRNAVAAAARPPAEATIALHPAPRSLSNDNELFFFVTLVYFKAERECQKSSSLFSLPVWIFFLPPPTFFPQLLLMIRETRE